MKNLTSPGESALMAEANQDLLHFGNVVPDWQSNSAGLRFALQVEVGEQSFEAQATTIQLQRGAPVPIDVIGMVLGAQKDGSKKLLESKATVDRTGNIAVEISEYDALDFDHLRLLLLPVVPDRALRMEKNPKFSEVLANGCYRVPGCFMLRILALKQTFC